jgi:hypothetical protein
MDEYYKQRDYMNSHREQDVDKIDEVDDIDDQQELKNFISDVNEA